MGELALVLFWPALAGYSEAAVAYLGDTLRPGRLVRAAMWGVRLGWLAQTALLVGQAAHADGFPWSSWAGALNLLSWLVVGTYLIWGSRERFRLLGIAVMPVAVGLLAIAYAGGGTAAEGDNPGFLLAVHVALMLAAFAGFTVGTGLSALYLWHERRLKRRAATILRLRVPPLETLDAVVARTVAGSLAVLTVGIAFGLLSLALSGGSFDAAMAATLVAWAVYGGYLLLRRRGLHGRRSARLVLVAFAVVLIVLPLTHFAS